MLHPILKRTLAFGIDFCIVMTYAGLVWALSFTGSLSAFREDPSLAIPSGMAFILFPVFLYYFLSERSKSRATLGKRLFKLKVSAKSNASVFWRNLLRMVPVVMIFYGLIWSGHYEGNGLIAPAWVYALALVPQSIEVFNLIGIVATRGESGLYDGIAGTRVEAK